MTDVWEALGQLAAHDVIFNAVEGLAGGPKGQRIFPEQSWDPAAPPYILGALILDGGEYAQMRTLLEGVNSGPVSLFAIGEIYRAFYFPTFVNGMRSLHQFLPSRLPGNLSAGALRALGCLIIDGNWRDSVSQSGALGVFNSGVTSAETLALTALARDQDFNNIANDLCSEGWDKICPIVYEHYTDPTASAPYDQHAHLDYRT